MQKFREVNIDLVKKIRNGGVLIYPTDTCLGVGSLATSKDGVNRLAVLKSRDINKPISLLVDSYEMASQYVVFSDLARQVWERFMPGELTMILPKKLSKNVALLECNKDVNNLGIRLAASGTLIEALITELGIPITTTSANLAGESVCLTYSAAEKIFEDKDVIMLIDESLNSNGQPSTIVEVVNDEKIKILRGGILVEKLNKEFAAYID